MGAGALVLAAAAALTTLSAVAVLAVALAPGAPGAGGTRVEGMEGAVGGAAGGAWRSAPIQMLAPGMQGAQAALVPTPDGRGADWVLQDARTSYAVSCAQQSIAFSFPPVALVNAGERVVVDMMWTTRYPTDRPPPGDACTAPSGVDGTDTRCWFGTGDFRVGLLESGAGGQLGEANGVQLRVSPHVSRGSKMWRKTVPFKPETCADPGGAGKLDAHTNASLWVRQARNSGAAAGHVMDDQCPSDCGFKSTGQIISGGGVGAPYNTPFPVRLELTRGEGQKFVFKATFAGMTYTYGQSFRVGFAPKAIDTLCLVFANPWRLYGTVELRDVRVSA